MVPPLRAVLPGLRRLGQQRDGRATIAAVPEQSDSTAGVTAEQLRSECAAMVADVQIPQPFELGTFCAAIAASRGRPIQLGPSPIPMGRHCGLTVSFGEADWILYEADTTRFHQQHIVLHEIGHLLRGDPGDPTATSDLLRALCPDLDPEVAAGMLGVAPVHGRSRYSAHRERAAETFASLLGRRIDSAAVHIPPPIAADAVLARIERSLGNSWRRSPT